jgi:hypothetical protein
LQFPSTDIFDLYVHDATYGRLRVKFRQREGKKPCAFINYKSDPHESETQQTFERKGPKVKKQKPVKLRGPTDISNRKEYKKLLSGEELNFEFLTPFENKLLMRRALGESLKKLARRYSGGHDRRSYTATTIKNLLYKCYNKIRLYDRNYKNVPMHIDKRAAYEKFKRNRK